MIVAQSGYANIAVYRDLLGAIRALEAGDRAPLLRLVAENTLDPTDIIPVRSWSEALYLAVTCHDYPQMWDPAAPLDVRTAQLAQARATLPPAQFAPFTATSWTGVDYEGATACLRWPGPRKPDPPVPPTAPYPAVPTLVLNGDLDNITASSGARVVADRFPRSTFVELQNSIHVTALSDRDELRGPARAPVHRAPRRGRHGLRDADQGGPHGRPVPCRGGGRCARDPARRGRQPADRPPRRGRGDRDGGRRDPALADQLQRREPRPARRALELRRRRRRDVHVRPRAVRRRRAGQRDRDVEPDIRRGARRPHDHRSRPGRPDRALEHPAPARGGRRSTARWAGARCAPRCSRPSAGASRTSGGRTARR